MRAALYIIVPALALIVAFAVWRAVLPACAAAPWLGRFTPAACPPQPTPAALAAQAETVRGEALRAELRRLELELAARAACEVAAVIGAGDPLDADLWAARDVALLEGCWMFDSDLTRVEAGAASVSAARAWRVCFAADGSGEQTIAFTAGPDCRGRMRAAFREDGAMSLADDGAPTCDPGPALRVKSGGCVIGAYGRASCLLSDGETAVSISLRRDG